MEIRTCEEYVLNELAKTQEKLTEVEEELVRIKSKYESLLKVAPMEITPGFNKNYYVSFSKSEVTTAPRDGKVWYEILNDLQA